MLVSHILIDTDIKVTQKLRRRIGVAIGGRGNGQYPEDLSILPERSIKEKNDAQAGSCRQSNSTNPLRLHPQEKQQARSQHNQVQLNAHPKSKYNSCKHIV